MKKLNLTLIFILYLSLVNGQKIESPFNEFTVSINRSQATSGNSFGFGFGIYHSPKTDSAKGAVIGIEYNHTHHYYELLKSYYSHFGGEKNITYTFDFFTLYAAYRAADFKSKVFFDLGGFFDIGISSSYYRFSGIFPGLSLAPGLKVPLANLQLIIKPEFKLFLSKYEDSNEGESFSLSYYRLAIGIKGF